MTEVQTLSYNELIEHVNVILKYTRNQWRKFRELTILQAKFKLGYEFTFDLGFGIEDDDDDDDYDF